jgi:hypothetical protein
MLTAHQVPAEDDPRLPRHRPHLRDDRSGRPSPPDRDRHSLLRQIHQLRKSLDCREFCECNAAGVQGKRRDDWQQGLLERQRGLCTEESGVKNHHCIIPRRQTNLENISKRITVAMRSRIRNMVVQSINHLRRHPINPQTVCPSSSTADGSLLITGSCT